MDAAVLGVPGVPPVSPDEVHPGQDLDGQVVGLGVLGGDLTCRVRPDPLARLILLLLLDQAGHIADRPLDLLGDAGGVVFAPLGLRCDGCPTGEIEQVLSEILDILADARLRPWLDPQPVLRPPSDVDLADRRTASARVEDDLPLQPRLAGLEQAGQFADGGGLADADTPDECDLMLTGLEEFGEAADFLLVEVDLTHKDILELWILPELAQLSEGRIRRPQGSHGSGDRTRDVPEHPTFAWRIRQADEPSRSQLPSGSYQILLV